MFFFVTSKTIASCTNDTNAASIRECGSILYVRLPRAVPHTNTNFRLSFLLIRLEDTLYEDLPVQLEHQI